VKAALGVELVGLKASGVSRQTDAERKRMETRLLEAGAEAEVD
jgi:hypothetical protein